MNGKYSIKMKVASLAYFFILAVIFLYPANDEIQEEWLHIYLNNTECTVKHKSKHLMLVKSDKGYEVIMNSDKPLTRFVFDTYQENQKINLISNK